MAGNTTKSLSSHVPISPTVSRFRNVCTFVYVMDNKKSSVVPQLLAAISATTIMVAAGFHMTWASPTLPKLLKDRSVPVTLEQSAWIVSLLTAGSVGGPLIVVAMVDRWGRKTTLLFTSIPLLAACVLIGFARSYRWYYVARIVAGSGFGAIFMLVPMYLGEISQDKIRGAIGILICVMNNSGHLIPYCVGPWISVQALAAIGGIISIIFMVTFVWIPESPYYYIMKKRPDCARKSLEWLRGTRDVDDEVDRVSRTVAMDQKNKGTLKELLANKGNRKALIIVLALFTAQQMTGNLPILNYSTVIFNEVTADISSEVAVIITGVVQLVTSLFTVFLADKAGRRPLILISLFFSTIFLLGISVYFQMKTNGNDVSGISWLPATSMVGYLCSYMLGIGSIPMAVMSEIFPCNVKAVGTTVCILYISVCSTMVLLVYPIISNAYGIHVAFYAFATGTSFFSVFIFFYLPETKGKSLADIQIILRSSPKSKFELEDMIEK